MGTLSPSSRNAVVAGGVVLLHVAALWALQSGLLRRAAEVIVPVELLSTMVTPPKAEAPPEPPKPLPPIQQPVAVRKPTPPAPAPAPRPVARADTTPAPSAPQGTVEPQPAPPPISAPVTEAPAAAPAPVAAPAPAPAPKIELPVTGPDYLHNPRPAYPRMSLRLGEQGTTLVRVLVGPDGRAQQAAVAKSSGFPRLDEVSVKAAMGYRFQPGKRGGVPEPMWVNVPIEWTLKKE